MTRQRVVALISAVRDRVGSALELRDIFWISGLASATYGISMVYEPAAWIVCGAVVFWMGLRA